MSARNDDVQARVDAALSSADLAKAAAQERRAALAAEAKARSFEALRLMRSGRSFTAASRDAHIAPRTMRRYVSSALDSSGRRVTATPSDRMRTVMPMLTPDGLVDAITRSSRQRSQIGRHWNAVQAYRNHGDLHALAEFNNVTIDGHQLATDPDDLDAWLAIGELDIDDIYSLTSI